MKKLFLLSLALLLTGSLRAQLAYVQALDKATYRTSYTIGVSSSKTTHLIFPYEIRYADLGSNTIAGEAVANAGNVFRIKAVGRSFVESSLTVITADGRVYSFRINYDEDPLVLTYDLTRTPRSDVPKAARVSTGSPARQADNLADLGAKALESRRRIKHVGSQLQGMDVHLKNILYKDDVMFLVLGMDNSSKLDYDIDFIHVFVSQEKKAGESSATQDVPVDPIKIFDISKNTVPHRQEITKVVAINRTTLEKDRRLMVQVAEKEGGRMLTLAVGPEELATARPL